MPPLSNFQKSCVALAIGQALTAQSVSAANITVTGTDAGGGDCTLRDAITSANDNQLTGNCDAGEIGPDTIILPAGTFSYDGYYTDNYGGYSMLPPINSDITLQGDSSAPTVIDADTTYYDMRILSVESGYSLTINALTLQNGKANYGGAVYGYDASITINDSVIQSNNATISGGAVYLYGGNLSITDSTVTANTSDIAGGGIYIYDPGTLDINNSDITANIATGRSGGLGVYSSGSGSSTLTITGGEISGNEATNTDGGGLDLYGMTLHMDNVTVADNAAVRGAGIYAAYSILNLTSVTLQSNNASDSGGAVFLYGGNLSISDAIVSGNVSTGGKGGAIFSAYAFGGATVNVERSSVSDNLAMEGAGAYIGAGDLTIDKSTFSGNNATVKAGAVYHAGASLELTNSTISGNVAPMMSAFELRAGAVKIYSSTIYGNNNQYAVPTVTFDTGMMPAVHNTIIAGNSGDNCGGDYSGNNWPPGNTNNWFDDTTCSGVTQGSPMLSPLGDNNEGLPYATLTHLPQPTSGVLNAGDPAFCTEVILGPGPFDQRGAPRNTNVCDIGAVEKAEEDDACFVVKAANGKVLTFCL